MASMSRTASTSLPKGFSVLQPTLGAPLSWMPAIGTADLEQLINAYLPGPASAQEKRAAISMDFFEYSAQTGENFKYYPVNAASRSPATSCSYETSPAISDLSYHSSPSLCSTPSASAASTTRRSSQKSSAAAKGGERTDFSHLPGMKIMTTAGEDVTNSASRGCKTKEQREHAHLMRVLKACDACKKKKIRCDPSHKRKSAPQTKSAKPESATKPTKKARKSPPTPSPQSAASSFTPAPDTTFDLDMIDHLAASSLDQPWDEFLSFNDDPINATIPQDFYGAVQQDFDFFLGSDNQFSPANSGSSGFTDSPALPLTPVASALVPGANLTTLYDNPLYVQAGSQEPTLPYLNDGAHGSNYVDFNLYSPSSSFIDEEPQKLKAGDKRKASAIQGVSSQSQYTSPSTDSPAGLDELQSSTGLRSNQQWRIDYSGSAPFLPGGLGWEGSGGGELHDGGFSPTLLDEGSFAQRPWHANDGGYGDARAVAAAMGAARPHIPSIQRQQVANGLSPPAAPSPSWEDTTTNTAATTVTSPSQSPRPACPQIPNQQQESIPLRGEAHISPRTVSPTELQPSVNRLTPRLRNKTLPDIALSTAPPSPETLRRPPIEGLLPGGGLSRLQVLGDKSSPSSRGQTVQACGRALPCPPTVEQCQTCEISTSNYTRELLRHTLPPRHARQILHGKVAIAASSSQPLRGPSDSTTSPVRQLLGHSSSMAQLVAFGLVFMTLSIVVGLTSLLQSLQTPSHIFTEELQQYLLASSSIVALLAVLLALMSSVLDAPGLDTALNAKSKVRGHSVAPFRRPLRGISARIPLACI